MTAVWDFELDSEVDRRAFLKALGSTSLVVGLGPLFAIDALGAAAPQASDQESSPTSDTVDGRVDGITALAGKVVAVGSMDGRPSIWMGEMGNLRQGNFRPGEQEMILKGVTQLSQGELVVVGAVLETTKMPPVTVPTALSDAPLHGAEDLTPSEIVHPIETVYRPAVWTSTNGDSWKIAAVGKLQGVLTAVAEGPDGEPGAVGYRTDESHEGLGLITATSTDGVWGFTDLSEMIPPSEGGGTTLLHNGQEWVIGSNTVDSTVILTTETLRGQGISVAKELQARSIAGATITTEGLVLTTTDIPNSRSRIEISAFPGGQTVKQTSLGGAPSAVTMDGATGEIMIALENDSTGKTTIEVGV